MLTERRMNRIFRADGRVLIVAMDHASMEGPCKGLEDPGKTIEKVVAGGADAILTTYGVARHFSRQLAPVGLILRSDGGSTIMGKMDGPGSLFYGVEEALRLGADALAVSGFPGSDKESESLENIATMARDAHAWGLAVMAEMVPGGFDSAPEFRTVENIALSARVGNELGADFIKTPYTAGFERVVSSCYTPVVILGGAKRGKERDMLADIKQAIESGASGVAIGRNIFQSENPQAMTAAVASIVHGNASLEEAMAILQR